MNERIKLERLLELEKFKTIAEIQDDIPFSCPEEYDMLKSQLEKDHEIINRLDIAIKVYEKHSNHSYVTLDLLQKIRDGK